MTANFAGGMHVMTTKEVAQETGIAEATLRWWRHTGQGPRSFKLGAKKVAYRREDVVEWLDRQYNAEGLETA